MSYRKKRSSYNKRSKKKKQRSSYNKRSKKKKQRGGAVLRNCRHRPPPTTFIMDGIAKASYYNVPGDKEILLLSDIHLPAIGPSNFSVTNFISACILEYRGADY